MSCGARERGMIAKPKLPRPKWQPPDPFQIGARVRFVRGAHAGKRGIVARSYRGRPAGLDRVHVEIDGHPKGWSVAAPLCDLEAAQS